MPADDVADRLAIADLVNRANAGVMSRDEALWGSTWAEDASWKIDLFDQPLQGREAILGAFRQIMGRLSFVAISGFVTDLVISGDSATGRAWSQETMFAADGAQRMLCGCFHDRYARVDGAWRFAERRYETLHRAVLREAPAG